MAPKVVCDKDAKLNELVLRYVLKIRKQSPQNDMFISGEVVSLFGSQDVNKMRIEASEQLFLWELHNHVCQKVY